MGRGFYEDRGSRRGELSQSSKPPHKNTETSEWFLNIWEP